MSTNQRRHRVLHVTFNMGIGGTEQVIRQLVTELPSDRFENYIACIDGVIGSIGEQLQKNGIVISALSRRPGLDLGLVKWLREVIQKERIDIVHCHQYTPYLYGWLAATLSRLPVIFTEHGRFYPDRYRYKALLINPVMALTTSSVVAISQATREALAKYEFIPRKKIGVIYNGIKGLVSTTTDRQILRKRFGIPENSMVFGTVSRLDPVKNQTMMLDAFANFLASQGDGWLLIVGDGPDRQLLEKKSKELAIESRVIFTGFIDFPADYMNCMDIFLLSSHTEGTSMTLLESMSLGIPSIVTNVGGNPEIVSNNETGLLTDANSSREFSSAMNKLYHSREERERLGRNSKKIFIEKFSVNKMIDEYAKRYSRALSE